MKTNPRDTGPEHLIVRLYRLALICFPSGYRREYADELLYAVRMAVADVEARGRVSLLHLAWRELRDLPLAIVRAHLHERKIFMKLQPGAQLPGGPIRSWQLGAVFLPFLLPLLVPSWFLVTAKAMPWPLTVLGLLLLGVLVVICVAGLVSKFPVWTLPALGMVCYIISFFLQVIAQDVVFITIMLPFYGRVGWPRDFSLAQNILLMLLVQLVFLAILVGAVILLLRKVPDFHKKVQQEWTLLSFLLYGIAILPVIGNDEFRGVEGYEIASLLVLTVGAGLYLSAPKRWQRLLALVVPAILSPTVMSLGLYQTFPAQFWANPADFSFRLWEALQPVLSLLPLPFLIFLASLAPRLSFRGGREIN